MKTKKFLRIMQGLRSLCSPLLMTIVLLLLCHKKGTSAVCQQKFMTASTLNYLYGLNSFKGAGSRNRKQTCYLYNLYCFPHVAIVFCTDFGGWGESTRKLLPKIHQYLCNRTTYECFVCFSTKLKSPSSKQHFYFEKCS